MNKHPFSYQIIRFQDCDPLSHLNNSRYLDYFMNAREDHLREYYNLDIYKRFKETGKTWVVAKSDIIYRQPAFLMEKVMVKTQVNNYSLKHIEVEMSMYDEGGTHLKAILRSVFVPIDASTNKSTQHEDDIMELLGDVRVDHITTNLEERVAELEGTLKVNS